MLKNTKPVAPPYILLIKNKPFKTKNEPRELSEVHSKVGHERRLKFEDANYRYSKPVGHTVTFTGHPKWVKILKINIFELYLKIIIFEKYKESPLFFGGK